MSSRTNREGDTSKLRRHLVSIESWLASSNPRTYTASTISQLENQLREIIMSVRSIPEGHGIQSKQRILANLREACDQLNSSMDLIEREGKTGQFYHQLRVCQEYLGNALAYW
jgi:hypothetical protein